MCGVLKLKKKREVVRTLVFNRKYEDLGSLFSLLKSTFTRNVSGSFCLL